MRGQFLNYIYTHMGGTKYSLTLPRFLALTYDLIKGTVSLGNELFLNSTHLLDINFCANNNCSKVFIVKKSKIHVRRHFPRIDMGWRPLAHVCLWLHVSSCLRSTRGRYIVSISMASIKLWGCYNFSRSFFSEINSLSGDTVPLRLFVPWIL